MLDIEVVAWIRDKYQAVSTELGERGHRRRVAAEARSLGRGGIAVVAVATGMSDSTIRMGMKELSDPQAVIEGRQRRPGGRWAAGSGGFTHGPGEWMISDRGVATTEGGRGSEAAYR